MLSLAQGWFMMLTPAAAAWAAGICLPILISLYVLKLRRRPARVSTSQFWARAAVDIEANVPWRRPHLSWLFALHLAIVLLLCAALGRPVLTRGGEVPDELVLVIDRSATMGAGDGPRATGGGPVSRLDMAKQRAAELLDGVARSGRTVRATLISFAAEARLDAGPTDNIALVAEAMQRLEVDDQPGNVSAAMRVVAGLNAAAAAESPDRRRVVLIGDGNWSDADTDAPAGLEFVHVGPAPGSAGNNLGIAAFAARRDDADPTRVRVFARVVNADDQPRATVVTLALNGTPLERRAVTVPARTGTSSGQTNVTMTAAAAGGVLTASLQESDALASDDLAGVTLLPPARPSILLVGPAAQMRGLTPGEVDARGEASMLLAEVVSQLPTASVRRMSIAQWEQEGRPLASVIIFDDVAPSVVPDAPTLSLGGGLPVRGLRVNPPTEKADAPAKARVVSWARTHPALRDLSLDGLVAETSGPLEEASGMNDLVLGDNGVLVREAKIAGRSHLVVAFGLSRSNWPLQVSFPLFVAEAVESLTRAEEKAAGLKFVTTQPVELDATAERVRLEGPRTVEAAASKDGTTLRAALGTLPRAGVYVAKGAAVPAVVSCVLDDGVSSLATRDRISVGGRQFEAGKGLPGPREIWSWALLAAAALLGLEWFVFARSSRPAGAPLV